MSPRKLNQYDPQKPVPSDEITAGKGYCKEHGFFKRLKTHVKVKHENPAPQVEKIRVIPATGNVDATKLIATRGICFMGDCKGKEFVQLRQHYERVHAKTATREKCNVCGLMVRSLSSHKKTHTGPGVCSVCNDYCLTERGFYAHRQRKHPRDKTAHYRLLTQEENDARPKFAPKNPPKAPKDLIQNMGKKIEIYELRLKDVNHPYMQRAQTLKDKLEEWVGAMPQYRTVVNASFATVYDIVNKAPVLVLQRIDPMPGKRHRYIGTNFYRDPKLNACDQPEFSDYYNTVWVRAHVASASSFKEELLAVSSYYYTNVIPLHRSTNLGAKHKLEEFLEELANSHGSIFVLNVIFSDKNNKFGNSVSEVTHVASIPIFTVNGRRRIRGWKLPNLDKTYNFRGEETNPFKILKEANIPIKFKESDFSTN